MAGLDSRLRRLEALRPDLDEERAVTVACEQIEAIIVQHKLTPADVERIAAEIQAELARDRFGRANA